MTIHSQATGKEIPSVLLPPHPREHAEAQAATAMEARINLTLEILQIVGIPPLFPLCGIRVGTLGKEGAR